MTHPIVPITVAYGDGIGPEIMHATLKVLEAAGAQIAPETIEIGEKIYLSGQTNGIQASSWESLRRTNVFLKVPITTPQGGGYKSLNVRMRKALGLYANIRPCISYAPFVKTKHPVMDLVIVRENEEDLYAGIEHRQTEEVYQCLKLITRPGCERIVRYAFEYAKQQNRKRVTCFVKDNIMKLTDGLFHQVFKDIAAEYPDIKHDSMMVDIGAARVVDTPEYFDVIVMPNLYGDIISDVAAQIAGSVGMAGSANIGDHCAMFEAIHGSAPDISGKNIANPSALLHDAIQMLSHIGQNDVAEKIHHAWLFTLEQGLHTADIYKEGKSKALLGTLEFADAVIANLGQSPKQLNAPSYEGSKPLKLPVVGHKVPCKKELVGIDIFLQWQDGIPQKLGDKSIKYGTAKLELKLMTNRCVKVWPEGFSETYCVDHWRCRFMSPTMQLSFTEVLNVQSRLHEAGFDVVKTENLYNFNGEPGYAAVHG
ncbi:NADP-dependent isocitrate dehydrogenase [Paraglaciecola sp. MB-3u-78]|uniref:NADP-dependent isocitrate dehydrogenase n=1 Tax=Paraglaciecola sp. MB-3u-78 TaxID=2058332 RepID=UPI000C345278|nr:NADP-dependent isocitrate dehydrogenase [Paraglaciecola sp. MB-3u-78]PKH00356.1 isocitrate dehydrogenase [Paraglaciecola sp. MB-3u-78]